MKGVALGPLSSPAASPVAPPPAGKHAPRKRAFDDALHDADDGAHGSGTSTKRRAKVDAPAAAAVADPRSPPPAPPGAFLDLFVAPGIDTRSLGIAPEARPCRADADNAASARAIPGASVDIPGAAEHASAPDPTPATPVAPAAAHGGPGAHGNLAAPGDALPAHPPASPEAAHDAHTPPGERTPTTPREADGPRPEGSTPQKDTTTGDPQGGTRDRTAEPKPPLHAAGAAPPPPTIAPLTRQSAGDPEGSPSTTMPARRAPLPPATRSSLAELTSVPVALPASGTGGPLSSPRVPDAPGTSAAAHTGDEASTPLSRAVDAAVNHMTLRHSAGAAIDLPDLGRVAVTAHVQGREIDVQIVAQRPETVHAIASRSDDLAADVRRADIPLGRLAVDTGNAGGPGAREQHGHTPRERAPDDQSPAVERPAMPAKPGRVRIVL